MADKTLAVDIVTPDKLVYSDKNIALVSLPADWEESGFFPVTTVCASPLLPEKRLHVDEQAANTAA